MRHQLNCSTRCAAAALAEATTIYGAVAPMACTSQRLSTRYTAMRPATVQLSCSQGFKRATALSIYGHTYLIARMEVCLVVWWRRSCFALAGPHFVTWKAPIIPCAAHFYLMAFYDPNIDRHHSACIRELHHLFSVVGDSRCPARLRSWIAIFRPAY